MSPSSESRATLRITKAQKCPRQKVLSKATITSPWWTLQRNDTGGPMEWIEAGVDDQDYQVVKLSGECDLYSAPRFARAMIERIESGACRLKLELTEVKYLDSTGVGALIRILQTAKHSGCAMF